MNAPGGNDRTTKRGSQGGGSSEHSPLPSSGSIAGKRTAIAGRLGGMTRRAAFQAIRDHQGIPVERGWKDVDVIVIGGDQLAIDIAQLLADQGIDRAIENREIEFLAENEFYQLLGVVEPQRDVKQLYTPAMLADLLKVSVRTIRRWHRLGLIQPIKTVHRLPYFDFQEIQSARRLAQWIERGVRPNQIREQLEFFLRFLPESERSIDQLHVIVEGRRLLMRKGEGLIDSAGQLQIDFDSLDSENEAQPGTQRPDSDSRFASNIDCSNDNAVDNRIAPPSATILNVEEYQRQLNGDLIDEASGDNDTGKMSRSEMLDFAAYLEDDSQYSDAMEWYRVVLARFGPSAEVNFQLAELLYRQGQVEAARERYYVAIEIDKDYVEARANLGCVLLETGRHDLALAAFRGAIALYPEYADVHYHLARLLDELGHEGEAEKYWNHFLRLAPESPWADEARVRLDESVIT